MSAQSAFALLGFASVTPQGVVAIMFVALSLLVGSVVAASLPTFGLPLSDEGNVGPLDARGRGALLLALAGAVGLPFTPGFYGMFSAVLGASARHPGTVLLLVIGAAFSLGAVAKVLPSALDKAGPGRAIGSMQSWALFGLVISSLLLGIFPATAVDFSGASIRDRIAPADPPGTAEVASL
jgi:NADH:ubiquinone oxidoreductase subunit 4 (subunit M)